MAFRPWLSQWNCHNIYVPRRTHRQLATSLQIIEKGLDNTYIEEMQVLQILRRLAWLRHQTCTPRIQVRNDWCHIQPTVPLSCHQTTLFPCPVQHFLDVCTEFLHELQRPSTSNYMKIKHLSTRSYPMRSSTRCLRYRISWPNHQCSPFHVCMEPIPLTATFVTVTLGRTLLGKQPDEHDKHIGFWSQSPAHVKCACDPTHQEHLAIIWTVPLLHSSLEGPRIKIPKDRKALE